MKITLGFSPCPNDTFIFDALVNKKIDTEGLEFETFLEDVETLNRWTAEEKLDVTKLSFPALFKNAHKYAILSSGAALGKGVGPLLVAKHLVDLNQIDELKIAIPGEFTTANFLLSYALPNAKNKEIYLFSDIEDAVLNGEVDLGVIIHENRFTYEQRGLKKIVDLGQFWEEKTGSSIPLGCIAVKRTLEPSVQKKIEELIRKSVEYSFKNYPQISDYVQQHAQAMDKEVMKKHIDLYVNEHTLDLGEEGRKSIIKLYGIYTANSSDKDLTRSNIFRT